MKEDDISTLADEKRGRKFAKIMQYRHNWRELTGQQMEQVLAVAEIGRAHV